MWLFSYGADMMPADSLRRMGLQPLQSLPAQLPGYHLEFNHRGGEPNIVQLAEAATAAGSSGVSSLHTRDATCVPVHGVLHRWVDALQIHASE